MIAESVILGALRAELDGVARTGFDVLRHIPSTYTWKVLDYVSALDRAEQSSLFDAFSSNALFMFLPERDPDLHAFRSGHPAYHRFTEAMPRLADWKYRGARNLRAILADSRSDKPHGFSFGVPDEVIRKAEAIQPAKANAIRKVIKATLSNRFDGDFENRGGGEWVYSGSYNSRAFLVHLDFGGRSDQLRYAVTYDDMAAGIRARQLTYEGMLGMDFGRWDYVTAQNLGEAAGLLCDLVQELVKFPEACEK